MADERKGGGVVCFTPFRLNLRTGELHKDGRKIRLQEQSFRVLEMLVDRAGEVVSREEIRKKLWPHDTVVEFSDSINASVKKLRVALGDSAEEPNYVETVARRGYRFIAPVEWVDPPAIAGTVAAAEAVPQPEDSSGIGGLTGKKVSHYRVLEVLGGGGMGLVYKAEDIKLGRRVAMKFLPEELVRDPAALERFDREARAASALDHPNICAIYEFGEHEGQPFIVMQLLQGQTLRERIEAGEFRSRPLPIDELLNFAMQIAEGLDAAHSKGIIHRDIKPANIFVTHRGEAKILDFGVAKLAEASEHNEIVQQSGAVSSFPGLKLTRTGTNLGTAFYMSPEQVRGEELDTRTDLFSFGLVLYEMATAQPAFTGDTAEEVHEAILLRTPLPVRNLNPKLPSKLEEIINRSLEKDRNLRYQRAAEMRDDFQQLKQDTQSRRPKARRWPLVVAGVFAVCAALGVIWLAKQRTSSLPEVRQRQLTANSSDNPVQESAISPDGKYLAYSDLKGIHIKLLETGDLQTVAQPAALAGSRLDWGVGWFPAGMRLFANAPSGQSPSIWAVSVMGGALRKIRDNATAWSVSPDGSFVAFTSNPGTIGDREIWLMGANGEQARKLYETDENSAFDRIEWSPDGSRIAYFRSNQAPDKLTFTLETRDLKGGPVTSILSAGPWWENSGIRDFLWLGDGRMIYALGEEGINGPSCNFWEMPIERDTGKPRGRPRRLTDWAGFCMDHVSATTDGKHLAFIRMLVHRSVYVADLDARGTRIAALRRLTLSESQEIPRAWTRDSKEIIFESNRNGHPEIVRQSLNNATAEMLAAGQGVWGGRISPDGRWLLYIVSAGGGGPGHPLFRKPAVQLMRVPTAGGIPQLVLTGAIYGLSCSSSPANLCAIAERTADHQQLIFTAFDPERGRGNEIARLDLVSDPQGVYIWELSPDGTRIAALKVSEGKIRILPLTGSPVVEVTVKGWTDLRSLDWAADGKGFFAGSSTKESSVLLYTDLQGNAKILWEQKGWETTLGVPSPDGRHLAILGFTDNFNVWMIENF